MLAYNYICVFASVCARACVSRRQINSSESFCLKYQNRKNAKENNILYMLPHTITDTRNVDCISAKRKHRVHSP